MAGVPLPEARFEGTAFWTGGERGELLITRCQTCGAWLHPPVPVCRICRGTAITPEKVSGRGTVHTFTVNHQRWLPELEVPYVVAIVQLDEDPLLRVTTRLVDVGPAAVFVGMRVRVRFEKAEDVWLPLFAPESVDGAAHDANGVS